MGSRVAQASEALAALDEGLTPDALLSDMVMPGDMSGLDLARAARERRPDLPVVLMTGYSAAASAATEASIELLTKPFTLDQLRSELGKQLRDRRPS